MTSTGPDPTKIGQTSASPDADPFRSLAASAADLLDAYAKMMGQFAGMPAAGGGSAAPTDMPQAVIEAGTIASGSAMRYGQQLTEIFSRHQAALANGASARLSGTEIDAEAARAEAEEFRRVLREVGETALREARRLNHELDGLSERVARGFAPPGDPDYKRRWGPTE
jgi:hypothetical protein